MENTINLGIKISFLCLRRKNLIPNTGQMSFRKSGAKYVIPVAEHHDGFAMYDCSFTRWCAAKIGPQRDIVGGVSPSSEKKFFNFWHFLPSSRALVVFSRGNKV